MKLNAPRITPLPESEWSAEQRELLPAYKEKGVYNVIGTLSRHWEAFKQFRVWAGYILGEKSTITPREREILILRIGWLCDAEYEWAQHALIGKKAGLSDTELDAIKVGADDKSWHLKDRLLLRATDELHHDKIISDKTWTALTEFYQTEQMMDIIFAVGQYNMVSMFLNSAGVQLDEGLKGY